MSPAQTIVMAAEIWLYVGGAVAVVFLTIGMDRIDEDARGAYVFRPLLIPGVLLIWPLVLWRWWRIEAQVAPWAARYRPVRRFYGLAAALMALGIAGLLIAGLSVRQSAPEDTAPIQLEQAKP